MWVGKGGLWWLKHGWKMDMLTYDLLSVQLHGIGTSCSCERVGMKVG